jgi:hypothetical protein
MRESDTFLAILDEGREIQARRDIRLLAELRLGEPDEPTVTRLEGSTDIERLERIHLSLGARVLSCRHLNSDTGTLTLSIGELGG